MREFLHVDDLADATVIALKNYEGEFHLNVGCGEDLTIRQLAELFAEVVGWEGDFVFDPSMPDGTPRKLLDIGRLRRLGWTPQTTLKRGIESTYRWFLEAGR